jgi:hypothetical protein
MATIATGYTFADGQTATPVRLNALAGSATITFSTGDDTDNSTLEVSGNKFQVKNLGITSAKLAAGAATAAKLDGGQSGSAPIYACRAFGRFNGSSFANVGGEDRCTPVSSGNVAKVVRDSVGQYTISFTTAMPFSAYTVVASCFHSVGDSYGVSCSVTVAAAGSFTLVTGKTVGSTTARFDSTAIDFAVFA